MTLVPKTYECLVQAVESGVAYGITRAFKYEEKEALTSRELQDKRDDIVQEVLNAIMESFNIVGEPEPK